MLALIALGANLPTSTSVGSMQPRDTLVAALEVLSRRGCGASAVSGFYRTPCFPPGAGPDYVNAAARLEAEIAPQLLLRVLHDVEAEFGRQRVQRWGMRTLDLDLIAAGELVLPDLETWADWAGLPQAEQLRRTPDRLILPHPRLADRPFVLVPMADIAPEWTHPVTGLSIAQMRDALPLDDLASVVPLSEP